MHGISLENLIIHVLGGKCKIRLIFSSWFSTSKQTLLANPHEGTYSGQDFPQTSYWPFKLPITHAEYRLARNKSIPTRVYLPDEIEKEYRAWRIQEKTKKTLKCFRDKGSEQFCSAVYEIVDKEVDSKLRCFLLELSEGLPHDEMYQTFYAKCSLGFSPEKYKPEWSAVL